ncbi:MAG: ribbon-helix-helix domain-containing protein [Gemmatimonadota bacterium]|nr:ribbon-helix-helix domain-containing protein [Gemmatimonadota bacterium]
MRGYYPESYTIRLPEGYLERISEAAREEGMSPAEWLRRAIRRELDAVKKKSRRR